MSKLQILIPQYNEDENKIKPLLDSIAIQQDIDFNDIEVFIGNDGSNTKLSVDFLKQYKYRIQYHFFQHGRLAATRQKLFNLVTAPYVMWCDADDCFINTIALSNILLTIDVGFDSLICDFIEQNAIIELVFLMTIIVVSEFNNTIGVSTVIRIVNIINHHTIDERRTYNMVITRIIPSRNNTIYYLTMAKIMVTQVTYFMEITFYQIWRIDLFQFNHRVAIHPLQRKVVRGVCVHGV